MAKKLTTKRITVEVTERDIKRGETCKSDRCAVALAIKRATRQDACVGFEDITTYGRYGGSWIATTPVRVRRFIERFDNHGPVKPLKFSVLLRKVY